MMEKQFDTSLKMRLTTGEKEALKRVSKAKGMNSSQWLRYVIRNHDRRLEKA